MPEVHLQLACPLLMFLGTHQHVTMGRGRGKNCHPHLFLANTLSVLTHHLSKARARAAHPQLLLRQHLRGRSQGRGGGHIHVELLMKRQGLGRGGKV